MSAPKVNWQKITEDYFTFTKFQRRAVFVLVLGIVLLCLLPVTYQYFLGITTEKAEAIVLEEVTQLNANDTGDRHFYHTYQNQDYATYKQPNNDAGAERNYVLFTFDPNTASAEEWGKLGIKTRTIGTIKNYLAKGGHFYKPEDIGKIWGLHKDEVERLIPYVKIAGKAAAAIPDFHTEFSTKNKTETPKYLPKAIDVNTADTVALIALPGIGAKLAQRIINYRQKLGGFYSVNQLGETFGLTDSVFQKIKPRLAISGAVRKININTASAEELKIPYLPYKLVNAIVAYRNQHGAFTSIEDLKKIMLMDENTYNKVAPYLQL